MPGYEATVCTPTVSFGSKLSTSASTVNTVHLTIILGETKQAVADKNLGCTCVGCCAIIRISYPSPQSTPHHHNLYLCFNVQLTSKSVFCPFVSDSLYSPTTKTSLCTSSRIHFLTSRSSKKEMAWTDRRSSRHSNTKTSKLSRCFTFIVLCYTILQQHNIATKPNKTRGLGTESVTTLTSQSGTRQR